VIKMTVEISEVAASPKNEFGVGVRVHTNVDHRTVPETEGATFVGLCLAINAYMHLRGAVGFNCLRQDKLDG